VQHPLINGFFQLFAVGLKRAAVPNFKAADGPHQAHFPAEPGIVPQIGGHQDAALAVQEALLDAGNQEALKGPQVFAKQGLLGEFSLDLAPFGLREGQDVTAEIGEDDLAILARAAMSNPTYAALVATVRTEVRTADGSRSFSLENRNELIGHYEGAYGVKTGTTANAGKCLIAMARRKGNTALLVLLNAPERWRQSAACLDRAFALAEEH